MKACISEYLTKESSRTGTFTSRYELVNLCIESRT